MRVIGLETKRKSRLFAVLKTREEIGNRLSETMYRVCLIIGAVPVAQVILI